MKTFSVLLLLVAALLAISTADAQWVPEPVHFMGDFEAYKTDIVNSNNVYVVHFYSDKCSSCEAFHKTWEGLYSKKEFEHTIAFVQINIDRPFGKDCAQNSGASELGLPLIVAHTHKGEILGKVVMSGEPKPLPEVYENLKKILRENMHSTQDLKFPTHFAERDLMWKQNHELEEL